MYYILFTEHFKCISIYLDVFKGPVLRVCFDLDFTARRDYFTHFEPSQSLGGAKTGDPRDKPPEHPQAELVSHVTRDRLEPTAV